MRYNFKVSGCGSYQARMTVAVGVFGLVMVGCAPTGTRTVAEGDGGEVRDAGNDVKADATTVVDSRADVAVGQDQTSADTNASPLDLSTARDRASDRAAEAPPPDMMSPADTQPPPDGNANLVPVERADLLGTWNAVALFEKGVNRQGAGGRLPSGARLVITEQECFFTDADGNRITSKGLSNIAWSACAFDATKSPGLLDITALDPEGRVYPAIYGVENGTHLEIAYDEVSDVRPTAFVSEESVNLLIAER